RTIHRPHTSPCMSTEFFELAIPLTSVSFAQLFRSLSNSFHFAWSRPFAKRLACLEHHQVKLSTLSRSSNSAIPTFVR
ncbi:unnamed protein product, partial [Musa banksii]